MPLSVQRRVPLTRLPLSGQFRQPSPRTRSTSPAALAIDSDRSSVNKTVRSSSSFVESMRTSTHSVPWPAPVSSRPRDVGKMIREDDSSTRQKEMSLSTTIIEETVPIDIPSQADERSSRDSSSPFADQVGSEVGEGTGHGTGALDSCWSAAWYSSEPWNRTTEYPEKAPAHIMIWEKRALRSASVAAEETRRRSGGVLEGAPSNEDPPSEDINIFELDM